MVVGLGGLGLGWEVGIFTKKEAKKGGMYVPPLVVGVFPPICCIYSDLSR